MCKKIRGDTLSALNVPTISFLWSEIWKRGLVHIQGLTKIGLRAEEEERCVKIFGVIPSKNRLDLCDYQALRIVFTMRYNRISGTASPSKASARSAEDTTRRLTQPTGIGGELGWLGFYHKPDPNALGGIHQGVLCCRAGLQPRCPTNRR